MRKKMNIYTIQEWLFDHAEGKFTIDLAESGIQYHHLQDIEIKENYDLNYSLDRGKADLRQIIANMYGKSINEVAITHGAQEGLYLFYQSYLNTGDHVITFSPGWQQAWEVPKSLGAKVTTIKLSPQNNYHLDLDELEDAITPKTKLIILTNPNNPTGTSSIKEMDALVELCKKHEIFLICDEEYFVDYPNSIVNKYALSAAVSSLSKVYGFPGLRLGWFIGPQNIVENVVNYKRFVTVSNSSLCEYLGMEVLKDYKKYLKNYEGILTDGYKIIENWLPNHPQLYPIKPEGTPFVYLKFHANIDSFAICKDLLNQKEVLVMPGEVFEDAHALRISYGRPADILREGLSKLSEVLK